MSRYVGKVYRPPSEVQSYILQATIGCSWSASNYLPVGGRLPDDRERIVATIDHALAGRIALRPEFLRAL